MVISRPIASARAITVGLEGTSQASEFDLENENGEKEERRV